MNEPVQGMHDNPAIVPMLPCKLVNLRDVENLVEPNRGTPWETCWEYVVSHELTPTEGAAFWTGANLALRAMRDAYGDAERVIADREKRFRSMVRRREALQPEATKGRAEGLAEALFILREKVKR